MSRWRAMTDAELSELQAHAAARHALAVQDRKEFGTPDAAQTSIAGALYWTLKVFWQDRPMILVGGVLLLIWQIGRLLYVVLRS